MKQLTEKYQNHTILYMETSAKNNEGIPEAFQKIAELSFDKYQSLSALNFQTVSYL